MRQNTTLRSPQAAVTPAPTLRRNRPAPVLATIGLLVFLGISAVAGGITLTFNPWDANTLPADYLDHLPLIDSWLVPGLVLGIGFGIGSLVTAYGMLRRPRWAWLAPVERATGHHWSWAVAIAIGLGHMVWILLELVYLPGLSPLEVVYGSVGAALVVLPALPSARDHLRSSRQ